MKHKLLPLFFIIGALSIPGVYAQVPSNLPADSLVTTTGEEKHRPGSGFDIIKSKIGTLNWSMLFTVRYLNQTGISNEPYVDAFGRSFILKERQELQVQKINMYFTGWLLDPKFRYLAFLWTQNAAQGLGAQLVLGGNIQYLFDKKFVLGAGIGSLPGVRSLYSNFPLWLRQDERPMADEFFRPSFTTGFFATGDLGKGFYYKTMLANNLSQLGVDANQLNNNFDTWSTGVWWLSPDFGRLAPYGDFEHHDDHAAYMFGSSYTTSSETSQSQAGVNSPENSQIRLSDGTGVFSVNAFGPGTQVNSAQYQMWSANTGIKYAGFSLDFEYFSRWVALANVIGPVPVKNLFDNGFTTQGSYMLIRQRFQFYAIYGYINGQYGKPHEEVFGFNIFPFKNRTFRINPEVMIEHRVPVGYLSYPTVIGATGPIYVLNFEIYL
ncbi:MAG TPA: hypothetical protein VGN20_12515 [Mucilaginibacter sp.]|jgi:hypothetical protein